jgi:hypothetical protein
MMEKIIEVNQASAAEVFSDSWLRHKPKFCIHQRVIATPGVVGRISGMQQVEPDQWRYQVFTPAQYGVTISWWEEHQLRELTDLFMISILEKGDNTRTRGRGTLDEAIADVRYFAQEAHRLCEEEGRNIVVQLTYGSCSEPAVEEGLIMDENISPNSEPLCTYQ